MEILTEGLADLLAPCGKCGLIKDRETGYIVGPDVMRLRTFNGSNRFIWQVNGRTVASLWIQAEGGKAAILGVFTHRDYTNAGLTTKLYQSAAKAFDKLTLSPYLDYNPHTVELIDGLTKLKG